MLYGRKNLFSEEKRVWREFKTPADERDENDDKSSRQELKNLKNFAAKCTANFTKVYCFHCIYQ